MPRAITVPSADKWHRAARSLIQVGFVQACIQLYNAFSVVDITSEQAAAITLVATPTVAFLQNLMEDSGSIPSILKTPPSTGANPVA